MKIILALIISTLISTTAFAANLDIQSFSKAKKVLEKKVYKNQRITLYCGAEFDAKKKVSPPEGFNTDKYVKRAQKIEWEHVVPAENFGRTFKEWREGDEACVSSKGKHFKGRKCAEKTNKEYRLMQADMFNLYPAIGAVNALRSNYNFTMLPAVKSDFGSCAMKIDNRKAEPPIKSRGRIARTYMYMDSAYNRYSMSQSQRQLMVAWDKSYPVDTWECTRAKSINNLQRSDNDVVKTRCLNVGLW